MKKLSLIITLIFSLIFITGCITIGKKQGPNAGVLKSFDKGGNWQAKQQLILAEGVGSIAGVNVLNLQFDPQDNNAIYLITENDGLLYTYDGGQNWFQPSQLSSGRINGVAVDPKDKCTIYVGYGNRVFKTTDCNRSWLEIYLDTRPQNISAIGVDSGNNAIIYAGTEGGEILKSTNGGNSWATIKRLGSPIRKIVADPSRGSVVYAATLSKGLFKTVDAGATWTDLSEGLKKFSNYSEYYDLVINTGGPDNLFWICHYGIIKTADAGTTWEALNLITPPLSTRIYAFAVNPRNGSELYYATASTFYKSENAGQTWITKRLPTSAAGGYLLVDPVNPSILYLGARNLK